MTSLSRHQMSEIEGGDIVTTVDAACAVIGVGAVFIPGAQIPGAFCAGWGAGRLIGAWL